MNVPSVFLRACLALPAAVLLALPALLGAQSAPASLGDRPVSLRFSGTADADLFTRELDASFQGVLDNNFVSVPAGGFPAGFVNASLPGFPWAGTMWTRDGGTFLRELVLRGYTHHAILLADCLIDLVEKNPDGFYSFPRYFKASQRGSGTEVDGTASIVIGMVLLWERLPASDPAKARIRGFLVQPASPVNYFKFLLARQPLVAGSGEFGCGMGSPGQCYNVVQNNMTALALRAAARMAEDSGSPGEAAEDRRLAGKIAANMEKYFVAPDGSWIWSVDLHSMQPDPAVLDSESNLGFGGVNGVNAMFSDVLGFDPPVSSPFFQHGEKSFERLYNTPLRRREFDRYGIWTQFDLLAGGFLTSPSYGQGYALQAMLLTDKLEMAGKALSWLVNATYRPVPAYTLHRASPYYFYERTYSPDAVGRIPLAEGCGALNLVNVTEPLKVSRLMLGVDDSSPATVRILPRIPPDWQGVEARNWPILTRSGLVRADISFARQGAGAELTVRLAPGQRIDDLRVRMPSARGFVWQERRAVTTARFQTH
jgi:hypothetical protein